MLNIVPFTDATYFTISHPNLTNASTNITVKMSVGCESTQQTFVISPILVTSNSFRLLIETVDSNLTRFADGIYSFEVTFRSGDDPITDYTTTSCTLVDLDLKCNIDCLDTFKLTVYKSLVYANQCDTCDCKKMCNLYNYLINKTTTKTNDTGCGCN